MIELTEPHMVNGKEDDMKKISCFLIGDGALTVQCADILLQAGHELKGIITGASLVKQWADSRNVPALDADGSYVDVLVQESFDYLFSIVYLKILPTEVLSTPQKAAINFHDGVLPTYAGLNTPFWALMNGEKRYGITWHIIEEKVDAGHILKQKLFDVDPQETSLTLNTKCFDAGIESYRELVEELASGTSQEVSQDLTSRGYYARVARPLDAMAIDWNQSAEKIASVFRALDFGVRYENPIGVPKLNTGKHAAWIKKLEIRTSNSSERPGTVIDVDSKQLVIATASGDVAVTEVAYLNGLALSIADFTKAADLKVGDVLHSFSEMERESVAELQKTCAKHEPFWLKQFCNFTSVQVPYIKNVADVGAGTFDTLDVELSEHLKTFAASKSDLPGSQRLLASLCIYLARLSGQQSVGMGCTTHSLTEQLAGYEHLFGTTLPLNCDVPGDMPAEQAVTHVLDQLGEIKNRFSFTRDIQVRYTELADNKARDTQSSSGIEYPVSVHIVKHVSEFEPESSSALVFVIEEDGSACRWVFDPTFISSSDVREMHDQWMTLVDGLVRQPGESLSHLSLLSEETRKRMIETWNETAVEYPRESCIHQLFEEQVQSRPDAVALVSKGEEISYKGLNERANRLAHYLKTIGVGAETLIGICTDRSADMVISALAVLKVGAAYVPIDPELPSERIAFMIEDVGMRFILTKSALKEKVHAPDATIVQLDQDDEEISKEPDMNPDSGISSGSLCYVIYTSGSTGRPKGVMVEHRNVVNFFVGMDANIPHEPPGKWLAVTSLSFDISVLELLWTLTRGFTVVLYDAAAERAAPQARQGLKHTDKTIDFSLFFFASDEGGTKDNKYQLLFDVARHGDEHGYVALWTPERHFHAFGGLYPNPSVASAALAAITKNIGIRAGSCVSPLHHSVRIAEDWAVVDNISQGRVGISFAAGWQPNDFILRPETFSDRKNVMFEQIDEVRALWRGDTKPFKNGKGEMIDVRTLPRPVQEELPVWVTAAGSPETFRMAGERGLNILTHLLGQSMEDLAEKVKIYREAWNSNGHEGAGTVTLMLHTFVGNDDDEVKEIVREPMKDYLRSSIGLIKAAAWSFPTFRQKTTNSEGNFSLDHLSSDDMDAVLDFSFERYYETSGLFGTVETCLKIVDQSKAIGVNEIACLVDYGVDPELVVDQLPLLTEVKQRANTPVPQQEAAMRLSIDQLIEDLDVTHLQCTPSMANMLVNAEETKKALSTLSCMMVGGEALPLHLARTLHGVVSKGSVINMYGPTETTIWSSTWKVDDNEKSVPIGRPIANTQLYVLDNQLEPVPPGVPGELIIAGDGVVRGYLGRPDLTEERFVKNTFSPDPDARMYRTGDLVYYRNDGILEYIGRLDHQVKIRGYRVELGEIESRLVGCDGVKEAVVIVREDTQDDKRIVAYMISEGEKKPESDVLKEALETHLPSYMIPAHFVFMDAFPLTPNKKIDRKALPVPSAVAGGPAKVIVRPGNALETKISGIWQDLLNVNMVGVNDNFFDIGGHSLLAVQVHRQLQNVVESPLTIIDLFRFPTIRSLAEYIGESTNGNGVSKKKAQVNRRVEARKAAMGRRKNRQG